MTAVIPQGNVDKELGKLTVEQFERVVRKLPELREEDKDFRARINRLTEAEYEEKFGKDFVWAGLYEMPLAQQIAWLFFALGRKDELLSWQATPDPQEAALNWADTDEMEDWDGGEGGQFEMRDIVALTLAMQRNILSIMLYHRSLAVLVDEVRQGVTESLFLAVRADRSILACPTISARIAKAELQNEKLFFIHLRSALKGPSKKHWASLHDLRYALVLLRELGLKHISDKQLEDLLVYRLRLYPPVASARKNLRKQLNQAKKFSTT